MSERELPELTRRLFDELAAGVRGIGSVHAAIAARSFRSPGSAPVKAVHDAISGAAYGALAGAGELVGRTLESLVPARSVSDTPRGALVLGILNGLIGSSLEEEGSALALPMSAHIARPDRTERIAVFLHGLMETDNGWRLGGRPSYGDRLAGDLGYTPVYVRYNSGRHVADNAGDLARLLEDLVSGWGGEVLSIALIGHSMGGLVARSACHQAAAAGLDWPQQVTHVVSLGTPYKGSPVAEFFHRLPGVLGAVPETRPLGDFFARRSAAVHDLRPSSCEEIPGLEHATHCFVSGSLARGRWGRLIGDSLVWESSARGHAPLDERFGHHIDGAGHFSLLNHPQVYEKLREWLAPASARATLA